MRDTGERERDALRALLADMLATGRGDERVRQLLFRHTSDGRPSGAASEYSSPGLNAADSRPDFEGLGGFLLGAGVSAERAEAMVQDLLARFQGGGKVDDRLRELSDDILSLANELDVLDARQDFAINARNRDIQFLRSEIFRLEHRLTRMLWLLYLAVFLAAGACGAYLYLSPPPEAINPSKNAPPATETAPRGAMLAVIYS